MEGRPALEAARFSGASENMERDTLETLVLVHQAQIFRYLRYLGAPGEEAEDLVQETFLAAFRRAIPRDVTTNAREAAWLRGIARHMFLRYCRRRRKRPVPADRESLEAAEEVWAGEFVRGGDGFDYLEALRRCLETISAYWRRALDLRYGRGESRAEMAEALQMSQDGIKSLLRRIRSRLAECVKSHLQLEGA